MTNDVLLTISGLHSDPNVEEEDTPVEVVSPAKYFYKNGKHFVLYDEIDEDHQTTKNTIRFCEDFISVVKHGAATTQILIEADKKNTTYYTTAMGTLQIVMDGKMVSVEASDEKICCHAYYGLEINYQKVADCELSIEIEPRNSEAFSLLN